MRHIHFAMLCIILLAFAACWPASSAIQRETFERTRLLDSLATAHPCRQDSYRIITPSGWRAAHACAVAARAVELLATSAPHEPDFAPGDTARIRAVSVSRVQTCSIVLDSPQLPGHATPVWYLVTIDVPQRPRWITVAIDASTLEPDVRGVSVVHKHFDGTDTLVPLIEPDRLLRIGGPCA